MEIFVYFRENLIKPHFVAEVKLIIALMFVGFEMLSGEIVNNNF